MPRTLQAFKIRELGEALVQAGYVALDGQADALGLCRSTTWTILQVTHKNSGLSATVINRMLACPKLPAPVRAKLIEYFEEKISSRYGHGKAQLRKFACRLTPNVVPFRRARLQGVIERLPARAAMLLRPEAAVRTAPSADSDGPSTARRRLEKSNDRNA
jgi:hypothetical protein